MSDTKRTTRAPKSASPDHSKPTKRRKVEHYFWVATMEAAEAMGVYMRSLCGVWETPDSDRDPDTERWFVEALGGIPLPEPRDCKRCLRSLAAHNRRRANR